MEGGELYNFVKAWLLIFVSISYCFSIAKIVPKGKTRLFLFLPVISLFLALPLNLSSVLFISMTAFCISWLANFKLLLYAFGKGPLFTNNNTPISLFQFIALASFPIKIKDNPLGINKTYKNQVTKFFNISTLSYAIKFILLASLIRLYDYSEYINPTFIMVLYCFHTYLGLDLVLVLLAFLSQAVLGFELEPQFNKPYQPTSLQDFWGKRWNIMASSILRETIYEPLLKRFSPFVSRKWAPLPAIMTTFMVSAIVHELIFYYLGRLKPTWEITLFFVLHGVCVVVEVALKKVVDRRWSLPIWITGPPTVGFLLVTLVWLFFPPFLRSGVFVKSLEEYAAVSAFMKKWCSWFILHM